LAEVRKPSPQRDRDFPLYLEKLHFAQIGINCEAVSRVGSWLRRGDPGQLVTPAQVHILWCAL